MAFTYDLDNWFNYHPQRDGQQPRYLALRIKAKELAELIVRVVPDGPDKTAAIRKIREAVMTANQGIACESEADSSNYAGSEATWQANPNAPRNRP